MDVALIFDGVDERPQALRALVCADAWNVLDDIRLMFRNHRKHSNDTEAEVRGLLTMIEDTILAVPDPAYVD